MILDPMREQLINLAQRLQPKGIKLIVGGGYGLILKTEYIVKNKWQTRFPDLPEARSTNDIDIFLSTEIITDTTKSETIRDALADLGFVPVANYFQFEVALGHLKVKIDLLAAPVPEAQRKLVQIKKPRIRPKSATNIHGFLTEEAITLEEGLVSFNLADEANPLEVFLPHPFTYLTLKLFALRDRLEDERKDFGAYHAFDIYRVIAMLTELEWGQALRLRDQFAAAYVMQDARKIVGELFSSAEATGILRIRQHARKTDTAISADHIESLIADLNELFPKNIDD
ncbi:MAG TPA: hypothetical protein VFZ34_29840 [Blastocatellia bacterium]|nr:hypothetical protein [Blastocatellia bacterium]